MLDKATAVQEVLRGLRKMEAGDSLELLTWKIARQAMVHRIRKKVKVAFAYRYFTLPLSILFDFPSTTL